MSVKWVDHVINDVPTLKAVISALVILDMNWTIISFAMVNARHQLLHRLCEPFLCLHRYR